MLQTERTIAARKTTLQECVASEKASEHTLGMATQARVTQEQCVGAATDAHQAALAHVAECEQKLAASRCEEQKRSKITHLADADAERKRVWLLEQQRRSFKAGTKACADAGYASPAVDYDNDDDCDGIHPMLFAPPPPSHPRRGHHSAGTRYGCGTTALIAAARGGHAAVLRTLFDLASEQCRPNTYGLDGTTALHEAAVQGHVAAVQVLCGAGAVDVNAPVLTEVPRRLFDDAGDSAGGGAKSVALTPHYGCLLYTSPSPRDRG